jgi:hypothetical protein
MGGYVDRIRSCILLYEEEYGDIKGIVRIEED